MKQIKQFGLRAVLAPIVRYCLRHGLKLQDLIDAAKPVFVDHARRFLAADGEKESISRVSLMTGVHRKDVTQLLAQHPEDSNTSTRNIVWKILSVWESSREFQTKSGNPRVLLNSPSANEFADLVGMVSKELNPYSVSLELQRMGVVKKTRSGLKLVRAEYQSSDDYQEALGFLSTDIDDLIQAVEQNVLSTPHGINHHVKTQFDEIPLSAVPELRSWINTIGSELHTRLRAQFSSTERQTTADTGPRVRVAFLSAARFDPNREDYFFKV